MIHSFKTSIQLLLMAALLSACSGGITIDTDHKAGVDFSVFKTYRWHDDAGQARDYHANDILDGRIREAVDRELLAKGFKRVTASTADFQVNYSVTSEEKTDVYSYNTYDGMAPGFDLRYGRGSYRYGYSYGYRSDPEVRTVHYEEGTLVVDMIDPGNKLIWRGSAEGRLKKNLTVEEKREGIKQVINRLLEEFPPESESR